MGVDHARRVRRSRSLALARVKTGAYPLVDAIREPPRGLRGCHLYWVLMACPGMGPHHSRTTCERAGVWPLLTLGELTAAQRKEVIHNLPPRARRNHD